MQIREATETDIPSIVELLKLSLGESLMPKSEAFWRWKHMDNPFGKSPVLLAYDNEKLIGVRAFMRWEWTRGGETIKAVRAVDTATHPQYQGQGIFRKLTLQLVEQCQAEGVQFIFNSPNKISKPGYLKMGWETLGRMKLYVKPVLGLKSIVEKDKGLVKELDAIDTKYIGTSLVTHITPAFLQWRYTQNPNISYQTLKVEHNGTHDTIVYRLKAGRLGLEFRICEQFGEASGSIFQKQLVKVARASGARLITSARPLPGLLTIGLNRGPEITIRKLSSLHNSLTFSQWNPTLGDMEVF
jgi:GNAT superfamily N-acetyltransferase